MHMHMRRETDTDANVHSRKWLDLIKVIEIIIRAE